MSSEKRRGNSEKRKVKSEEGTEQEVLGGFLALFANLRFDVNF
jgi:hypothetical protein